MSYHTNTANQHYNTKLDLRRDVLRQSGWAEFRVLDLFAGRGELWRRLRTEFRVTHYTPVDKSPQLPGTIRLEITPRVIPGLAPGQYNVIDVDCYGEPWELFAAIDRCQPERCVVFLTAGRLTRGACRISRYVKRRIGIPMTWTIPETETLARYAERYILSLYGERVEYGVAATGGQHVTYYGLLLRSAG